VTLSLLKLLQNWRKVHLNLTLYCGAIWRRREKKTKYGCTTTIPHVHKSHIDVLEILIFCTTFGAHTLVPSEPFLDSIYELWQSSALYRDVVNFFLYMSTFTFLAVKYGSGIFWKLSASYTKRKWCAQTFAPIFFLLFAIFDRNFAKMWRHLATQIRAV